MSDCIFCDIVAGRGEVSRVYEDTVSLAFMNLRQANPGHVLVIPKAHVATILELDEELVAQLFQTVRVVARAVQKCFTPDGITIWQSNGIASGQEIFHTHVHVLPRRVGDEIISFYPNGDPLARPREELDSLAAQLGRFC